MMMMANPLITSNEKLLTGWNKQKIVLKRSQIEKPIFKLGLQPHADLKEEFFCQRFYKFKEQPCS